jgi:signal transduction histidine kinase
VPARQTWRITQQLRETTTILGPARLLVSDLQAGLARELGALQGYALSRDRTQLARYRAAAEGDDRRLAALEHATPQLGAPPASQLEAARAGIRAWRQVSESLVARQITARELAEVLETVQARYDAAVEGVAGLSTQLAAESVVRGNRVRSLEQFSIVANAVLVLVAFAALAGVAGLTRSERRLAGSLQRSIDEARQRAREEVALREAAETLAGAFTVGEVTQAVVCAALEAMHGSGAFVAQLADVTAGSPRQLVVQAAAGDDAPALASVGSVAGVDIQEVLGGGAPRLIPDLDAAEGDDATVLLARQHGSAIVVPLDSPRIGSRALFVLRPPHAGFRSEDVARAAIFGHLATLAYEKVSLLDEANEGRRKLERAMTSRSRLMRGFSHDVKNPIGAADGFAELLSHGIYGDLTAEQQASVERLRRSLRRALSLIDDLHELARAETGAIAVTPEAVDIAELVNTIGEEYHAVAEAHGLEFEVVAEPGIPLLVTNGARVRQVASNLLSNAIKYTDAGSVRVRARRSSPYAADAPATTGHDTDSGEWVVIEFADSGPGIPLHQQDFIFEEFSRLNADKPGAGLGLAISELLAQALGGRISVESEPGRGSTFTFWIPLRESRPEP